MFQFSFLRGGAILGVVAMSLSACGGSSTPNPEEAFDDFVARSAFIERQALAIAGDEDDPSVNGIPRTRFDAMPNAGTATFNGVGGLVIYDETERNDESTLFFVANSEVTVDFASEEITGSLTRLKAADIDENAYDVQGRINLSGGDIGVNRPNDWSADYRGTLTVDGDRYAVRGELLGDFHGTRTGTGQFPIKAISGIDEDGTATSGGRTFNVSTGLVGRE